MNTSEIPPTSQLRPIAQENGCLHLECGGNLDFAALAEDSDPLTTALGADVYTCRVLLNCEKLRYLDTSGVSWLIDCHKRFGAHGGRLVLYAVPPLAQQLIRLLGLERLFYIRPDLPSARAAALGNKS